MGHGSASIRSFTANGTPSRADSGFPALYLHVARDHIWDILRHHILLDFPSTWSRNLLTASSVKLRSSTAGLALACISWT